jgi:DNA-binding XRE family transcriptional regulator
VNDTETLETIGRLVVEARVKLDISQIGLARDAGIDVKTIRSIEKGLRTMHDVNQFKIERALGWREGSIRQVWLDRENLRPEQVTMEDMALGADAQTWRQVQDEVANGKIERASLLNDDELISELLFRFRNKNNELSQLRNFKAQQTGDSTENAG